MADIQHQMVKNYIDQIRKRGSQVLGKKLGEGFNSCACSTALLSWSMYILPKLDPSPEKCQAVVDLDAGFSNKSVGENIFARPQKFDFTGKQDLYDLGLKIIAQCWPDLGALIENIKPRFCPPTEDMPFESVSDPKIFSQVYFAMTRTSAMGWAEIIAHEIGHQYLFVVYAACHKTVEAPWKDEFYSAIRNTNRPLIGIFHGVVAESFMIHLAKRVLDTRALSEHHAEAENLINRQSEILLSDFATVNQFSVLSMSDSLGELVREAHNVAKGIAGSV